MDSVNIRWHQEQLPGLERTVTIHRNSAEAWELLGDAYYHAGPVTGHGDWSERSKLAFARALTLDPAIAIKAPGHLSDLAFIDGDRGGHEHFARLANEAMWIWENPTVGPSVATRGPMYRRYQAAILRGRPATVRAARIEYSRAWARGDEAGPEWALRGMTLPPNELDALLGQMEADATTDSARRDVHEWLAHAAAMSGRPARARELLRRALLDGPQPPRLQFLNDLVAWAEDDSAAAEEMILLARQQPITGEMKQHPPVCEAALSRLRRGDTTGVEAILASEAQLNDTLGVISQRTLGTAKRWREIAELNKLDDEDLIPAGTVLKVPPMRG
jgi:hypothetical protein